MRVTRPGMWKKYWGDGRFCESSIGGYCAMEVINSYLQSHV